MGRLTYTDSKGSWGLKGVDWKAMLTLPPQVYGALAKLKDMENLIDVPPMVKTEARSWPWSTLWLWAPPEPPRAGNVVSPG